ncbi:MAG TPA: AI-2E family transporter [Flavihumibacter sp.]|nr:AI-2E family transporter [Flavihumibacter sp.]
MQTANNQPGKSRLDIRFPFFIKAPMVLLGLYLLFYILVLLQDIFVPICFALLLAILLNPLVNTFNKFRMPRVLSIGLAILLAILAFGGLITFLSVQFASFSDLAPQLSKRSTEIFAELQSWAQNTFGLSLKKQSTMISELFEKSKEYIGSSLSTLASVLSTFILLPIYVFLILYYKPMFINFFYEVFDYVHGEQVSEVLTETKSAIQSYILGLLIEMLIVAALNATALLIIGVKYAILLGVVGAILNVIPYVGGLIAIALPVLISMVTKDPLNYTTPLVIIAAYIVIQFIDNNIIVPRVVSSKVEVNAFVSIVIVLLGGALWGISGMFLSIPFVAILKIIFDRVNELKPWGMLLGTKMNPDFSAKKSIDLDDIKEE